MNTDQPSLATTQVSSCPATPAADPLDFGTLASAQRIDLVQLPSLKRNVRRWQTAHGGRASFVEAHELDILDVVLRFDAGSRLDGDSPGLAAATLYMLDQGAGDYDAQGLASALEDLGAQFSREVHADHATLSLRCLATPAVREPAVQLLATLLGRPRFAASAMDKIKARLLAHLSQLDSNPASVMQRAILTHVFADHPYAAHVNGTTAGVQALAAQDLHAFHGRAYSANNVEIALVGNLSFAQAQALAQTLSDALPQHWAALPPAPPQAYEATRRDWPGAGSTQAVLAMPLPLRPDDADYETVLLGCDILGSSFDSRLMSELRTRRSLTYSIRVTPTLWRAGGVLKVEWDVAAEYTEASRRLVLELIDCLIEQGPSPAELTRVLNQRVVQLLLKAARNDQRAAWLTEHGQWGLPADYLAEHLDRLAAVTPQQVAPALRRWIDTRRMSFFSIGPQAAQQRLPDLDDA
ncbi:pitrilysin family protein [Pseudomonas sp.]|uniref:M16 family metallopeptidase n=1 Tax=Pseudomonas sp. TaxID=306 RepID=UPI0028B11F22|nr:pitrilysin family protein [Pseudomonas sp.]